MVPRIAIEVPVEHALRIMGFIVGLYSMAVPMADAAQPMTFWTFTNADRPIKAVAIWGFYRSVYIGGFYCVFAGRVPAS
jgi:hypothetical protein